MEQDDKESSGIVCAISKHAGTLVGTSVVIGKKIAGSGVKTMTGAKDWLKRPLKALVPAGDKNSSTASESSAGELVGQQETGRKKAAKALIAALEADLATAQRELKKAHNNAEKTHSNLALQLSALKAEKESLISDLEQAKGGANEASFREAEVKMRVTTLEADLTSAQRQLEKSCEKQKEAKSQRSSDLTMEPTTALADKELNVKIKEQPFQKAVKAEIPAHAAVTEEQVQAAVFPNATDKVIFMRALSDIASQDAAVRADAAQAMAGVHHLLSVKALAARMASEASAQVRHECIKSLTTLQMTEGLGAVEQALSDQSALVRLAAVWGLYRLAGAESGRAMVRMLSDEDVEVRRRAATCIGWLGREKLASELLPLLDDSNVSVRLAAIEAVSNLRCRQGVTALIECLNDPEKTVKKAVLSALEKITGKKMNGPFPRDRTSLQRLIARWHGWWKEEQG